MYSIILAASISPVVAVAIYAVVTNLVIKTSIRKRREAAVKEAEAEGEMIKKERILQAKEKFIQLKSEYDRQVNERNQKIAQSEQRAKQIEQNLQNQQRELENKLCENDRLKEQMQNQLQILEHKKEEVDQMQREQNARLEQISGMSSEDAKNILIENMKAEAKTEAAAYINETVEEAKLTATKEAKRIIVASIQRVATETAIENAVTVFNIESDEVKGRIIGREGRNIRALEAATGIEIIVDDTPEAIILSGFDPVRREIARLALHQLVTDGSGPRTQIARLALHQLVTDGRIHPARIEEVVAKVQKQIEEEIVEVGKRTTIDLGIHGLHPELIRMIGKMKYRSSYGQNLLQHARETANLAGIMASELGLNPKIARRAGLLHDIGKVPDDEPELPHAIIGMKLAEKFKEKPEVCNAIGAHHDEVEMTSLIAPIIQVCDAISGARPGARREVVESYIKRLKEMEDIALSYPGVVKTYAIQAGRELRVIVGADKLSDQESEGLSHDIAKKIQDEMTYPGQVKAITVIRETRAVSTQNNRHDGYAIRQRPAIPSPSPDREGLFMRTRPADAADENETAGQESYSETFHTFTSMNKELERYIEREIIPRYEDFDAAHRTDHVRTVIAQSLELAAHYDADADMVYTVAAYHDTGLANGRERHHIDAGRILAADTELRRWFSEEQIAVMRDAVEDHRASSDANPAPFTAGSWPRPTG